MPITATGLLFVLIMGVICFTAPRRYAVLSLFAAVLWMPIGQSIDILGFHFYAFRFITLLSLIRVLIRREFPIGSWTVLDKTVLVWAAIIFTTSTLHKPQVFSTRLGMIYNFAAPYVIFRCLVTDFHSFKTAALISIMVFLPMTVLLVVERQTGKNWFYLLGGVEEISAVRDGQVRAQGPFGHPINAGVAGAMTVGLALFLWQERRKTALLGICVGLVTICVCSSSGPVMAGGIILGAACCYRWRAYSKQAMRWGFLGLIALQLAMNAPVWYLIARVKVFGGSTAWHRAELINSSFKYFNEWWLAGTDVTRHWMPGGLDGVNEDFADITSEYVWMMVAGGLGLFLTFVVLLVHAFRCVGKMRAWSENGATPGTHPFEAWAITGMLLTFSITFLTISYFDQVKLYWSFTTAAISSWWASTALQKAAPADTNLSL